MVSLTKLDIILVIFVFLVTFFVSTIFGIILFFFLLLVKKRFTAPFFFYVIFVISLISFTQYSRWSTTNYDMVGYYTVYDFFSHANFSEVLFFIFKKGDIFFYFLVFLISKIFPNDPRMLGFIMPFLTASLAFLTIINFKKFLETKYSFYRVHVFLWCFAFFFIISFPNFTNAYRQFLSIALFIYAVSLRLVGKKKLYLLMLVFSALSHWSSIIIIALYYVFLKFQKEDFKVLVFMLIMGVFSSYVLMIIPLPEQAKFYLFGNEILGIDKTQIILGTLLQIILFWYYLDLKNKINSAYVTAFLLLGYNFFFIVNSTLLTRHSFLVTYFITVSLISYINIGQFKRVLFIPLILITVFFNIKQLNNGEFEYMFFSKKMYFESAMNVFSTPFPYEIIR